MSPTWGGVTPADLAKLQAGSKAKSRKVRLLGPPDPVDLGGRNKEGAGFRARDLAKRRAKRAAGARPKVSEALVLRACMDIVEAHPAVALWWRQNTGAGQLASGRYVKFSFRGASDLMLVLKGGRFGAVEVKATGRHASPEQAAFLTNVHNAGGASICVDDAGKLVKWLDSLAGKAPACAFASSTPFGIAGSRNDAKSA